MAMESSRYQDYNMVNLIGEGRNGAVFIATTSECLCQIVVALEYPGVLEFNLDPKIWK